VARLDLRLGINLTRQDLLSVDAASLDLDFTQERYSMGLINKPFGDIITFTRASAATRINAAGQIETVAANVPRIDYDPVTLQRRGILIEEQRTNLCNRSSVFSTGTAPNCTRTLSGVGSKYGTNFWSLTQSAPSNEVARYQFGNTTAGTTYSAQMLLKRGTCDAFIGDGNLGHYVKFDLQAGTVSSTKSATGTIKAVGGGEYLCTATWTPASNGSAIIGPWTNGVADRYAMPASALGEFCYAVGAQLEAGAFATSYIPTAGSQVTRAADVASINTLSPWYNQTEGTLFAEFSSVGTNAAKFVSVEITNTPRSRAIGLTNGHGRQASIQSGTFVLQASYNFGSVTDGVTYRRAIAYGGNKAIAADSGVLGPEDTDCLIDAFDRLLIGNNTAGSQLAAGYIRRIHYYPKRLTNDQLQSLTA